MTPFTAGCGVVPRTHSLTDNIIFAVVIHVVLVFVVSVNIQNNSVYLNIVGPGIINSYTYVHINNLTILKLFLTVILQHVLWVMHGKRKMHRIRKAVQQMINQAPNSVTN